MELFKVHLTLFDCGKPANHKLRPTCSPPTAQISRFITFGLFLMVFEPHCSLRKLVLGSVQGEGL